MIVQNGVAFDFAIPQARHTPDQRVYPPPTNNGRDTLLSVRLHAFPKGLFGCRCQMPGRPVCLSPGMLLFSVGNSQGFSTFVNLAPLEEGLQQFMRRACMTFAYTLPCLSNQLQVSTLPFFAACGCTDDIPDSEGGQKEHSNEPLPANCLVPKPLKWQADQIIYTDGSIRDTGESCYYRSGTGVYRPASDVGPSIQLCIDPIGRQYGVGNTIQRAETVGLHQALSVPHCYHERVIATDSMCNVHAKQAPEVPRLTQRVQTPWHPRSCRTSHG